MKRLILLFITCSAVTLTAGLWIPLKAMVAQELLTLAWAESEARQTQVRPWPWADTWPVARLSLPGGADPMVVLEGAHGESLAFGPGQLVASGTGGGPVVIAGHRDTHFRALKDLETGERIGLQLPGGDWQYFEVEGLRVVDSRREMVNVAGLPGDALLLVTCYPFDAVSTNGPLRYVVQARRRVPAGPTVKPAQFVTVAGS